MRAPARQIFFAHVPGACVLTWDRWCFKSGPSSPCLYVPWTGLVGTRVGGLVVAAPVGVLVSLGSVAPTGSTSSRGPVAVPRTATGGGGPIRIGSSKVVQRSVIRIGGPVDWPSGTRIRYFKS